MYYTRFDNVYDREFYIKENSSSLMLSKYAIGYFHNKRWVNVAYANEKHLAQIILITLLQTTTVQDIDCCKYNFDLYDLRMLPPNYEPEYVIDQD